MEKNQKESGDQKEVLVKTYNPDPNEKFHRSTKASIREVKVNAHNITFSGNFAPYKK